MKKSTKIWIIVGVVLVLVIAAVCLRWELTHGNRQLIDTKFRFDRGIIRLPNGETVDGKVESWLDFSNSDTVQVKINGVTYLTHYSNVCLISD